jgi:hypothetical protein
MERNHNHRRDMKKRGFGWRVTRLIALAIGGILLAGLFALVLGIVVQWLWNWLMPDIFGLRQISYWQAFGLLFLGRLLFGGFGHHRSPHPRKPAHRRPDRWNQYKHFWQEEGEAVADEFVKRAGKGKSAEMTE